MPSPAQRLTDTYRRNLASMHEATADLPAGADHERVNGASSLNWILGHVLGSRLLVLSLLNTTPRGVNMDDICARYGKGTHPDPECALPLADLMHHLNATQDTLAHALATGDLIDFFGWHEGYHAGQLTLLHHQLSGKSYQLRLNRHDSTRVERGAKQTRCALWRSFRCCPESYGNERIAYHTVSN